MSSIKLSIVALSTAALFVMSGCGYKRGSEVTFHASGLPHHEHPYQDWWTYQFVYHPHAQVYFEPYSRTFFWNEDGHWVEGKTLPTYITIDPDHAKVVYLKSSEPHAQHITVVAQAGPAYGRHDPSPWPNGDAEFAITQAPID